MMQRMRRDRKAVSAVVTFILLSSVAMILISNWLNVSVPMWGSKDEERHMAEVQNQFVAIRSSINSQVYADNTNFILVNNVVLGTNGAAYKGVGRANGDLVFNPQESSLQLTDISQAMSTKGDLRYTSTNLYYPDQSLVLESGAIIKDQDRSSVMIAPPDFLAEIDGGTIYLKMVFVSLTGAADSASGAMDVVVYTRLISREYNQYDWSAGAQDITVLVQTQHPNAWATYFQTTMRTAGFREAAVPAADGEFNVAWGATSCTMTVANVDMFDSMVAVVDVSIQ
jgi:hypothetical protein